MKGIQCWSVNDRGLVPNEHFANIIKRVDDDCTGVAKFDLEDGVTVLTPPFLTDGSMVLAKFEKMPEYGDGTWYLRDALDVWNVCRNGPDVKTDQNSYCQSSESK